MGYDEELFNRIIMSLSETSSVEPLRNIAVSSDMCLGYLFLTPKGKDVLVTTRIVVFLYLDACVISSYIFGICESRESQCSLL